MNRIPKQVIQKRPSLLVNLYNALRTRKFNVRTGERVSPIQVEWRNISLDSKHLQQFNRICGLESSEPVHLLYPFTLIYPLNLWMLCLPGVPVPVFRMLTTANTTIIHHNIKPESPLLLTTGISGQQLFSKGMELYIDSELSSGGKLLWENRSTLYVPGRIKGETKAYEPSRLEPLNGAVSEKQWFLPARERLRFARIMGDSNGIHYSKTYARMLGFERDFAQPMRVLAKSMEYLPKLPCQGPLRFDMQFKGPLYYNRILTLKYGASDAGQRFDLYCEGNGRPCICCSLETAETIEPVGTC